MAKCFKEPVNAISHLSGAVLSVIGLVILVIFSMSYASVWHTVSFSIYGGTLILLYLSSTLYHSLRLSERWTLFLRRVDHMMIYLFIAGSYTPICLVPLRGTLGWTLLSLVWTAALAGIFLKLFFLSIPRLISTGLYLSMGWAGIFAFPPLFSRMPAGGLVWLTLGGIFYSVGAVIYGRKSPDPFPGILGFHGIWHFFVLAGSFCHYWMMLRYVTYLLPGNA